MLSQITNGALALSNLILVTPNKNIGYQPQLKNVDENFIGPVQTELPKTLLFDYEGEQSISLNADITDHYIEDNTAIQDQIAIKPVIITTQGFIGELNDIVPESLEPLKKIAQRLLPLTAYSPELTETGLIAYTQAVYLYSVAANTIDNAVSSFNSILNGDDIQVQNKQQIMYGQFEAYFKQRTLFTVQTPWAIFTDMAIQSLRAVQSAETRVITDFEVTFKQIRFARTFSIDQRANTQIAQGRLVQQKQGLVDLGPQSLDKVAPVSAEFIISKLAGAA